MKKTVTVNLNRRVFTMDEDAYALLDSYLHNLRIYFRKEEDAKEIIADFEARIAELFTERTNKGLEVINLEDVEQVISQMGGPSDFDTEDEPKNEERKVYEEKDSRKKFYRNPDDKLLGGVCSGLAAYFGWDVLPVRIICLLLLAVSIGWFAILYLVLWGLTPMANTVEEKLQMRGKPITVENIGKTVAAEAEQVASQVREPAKGCLNTFVEVFVAILKFCLVCVTIVIGIPLVIVAIVLIVTLIATIFGLGIGFSFADFSFLGITVDNMLLANISLVFIILIPVLSILYSIVGYFAKFKPLHSSIKWGTFIIWIIALVAFFSSGIRFDSERFKEYVDREDRVYRVDDDNFITYENDDMTDRVESLPLINSIKVSGGLSARLEIEQKDISETCLHISADKDIIDDIRAKVDNKGRLVLESKKDIWFLRNRKKILIRLETPDLNDIQVDGANDVVFVGAFRSKEIDIEVNGAGNIYADSLYVDNVKTHIRGAGDVKLAGEAKFVDFNIAGAGDVRALNLVADTVVVETNGAGDVHCNPIKYLDAKIRGAGEIRYKEEPENKNVSSVGVGSIGKK